MMMMMMMTMMPSNTLTTALQLNSFLFLANTFQILIYFNTTYMSNNPWKNHWISPVCPWSRRTGLKLWSSHTKDSKKWFLMPPCLILIIIRCESKLKWRNPRKSNVRLGVVTYEKGVFWSPLTTVANNFVWKQQTFSTDCSFRGVVNAHVKWVDKSPKLFCLVAAVKFR